MRCHGEYLAETVRLSGVALAEGRYPVAALIVDEAGRVMGCGFNTTEERGDPTCHAEVEAIRSAAGKMAQAPHGRYVLYSSWEPCLLCAGAMLVGGIEQVVWVANASSGGMRMFLNEEGILTDGRRSLRALAQPDQALALKMHRFHRIWHEGQKPFVRCDDTR